MEGVNFQSCAVLDNKAWFVTVENHFMCMDLNTGESHYVMPKGNRNFYNVVDAMVTIGNEIYWADQNGSRLLSYQLDSEMCKTYAINHVKVQNYVAFSLIVKWRNSIILVPKYTDKILIFDTRKKSFTERCGIFTKYIDHGKDGYVNHAFSHDKYIYILLSDNCTALRYSMDTDEISTVERNGLKRDILGSYWCEDVMYVLDSDGNVMSVNSHFEIIRIFTDNTSRLKDYCCLFVWGDHLVMLPSTGEEIITIHLKDAHRETIAAPKDMVYMDNNWGKYIGYLEQKDFILIPNRKSDYFLILDKNNFSARWIRPVCPGPGEEAQYMAYAGIDSFEKDNLQLLIEYVCLNTG